MQMKIQKSWDDLAKFGKSKTVRTAYIWLFVVPLAAKALLGLKQTLTFDIAGENVSLAIGLPFSWKLFFFSAVSFSVATALFQFKCPKIIQEHDDYAGFVSEGKGKLHLDEYAKEAIIDPETRQELQALDPRNSDFHKQLCEVYWKVREAANISDSTTRKFCLVFNYIGLILITIVAFENVCFVIRTTVNW
ncbi:hypothetical protein A6X21_15900 [Planctopirus hydrillae]|uniref:Uncharacterized protein n=2 Tax=Planctopirus hydrillae TaxID=1841610 RepID=A0A1C3ETV3_9PLAN|nr:hypothetical protein A6X21_15900 [Planctopirus hydrillae]